jgi:hypothetical protein
VFGAFADDGEQGLDGEMYLVRAAPDLPALQVRQPPSPRPRRSMLTVGRQDHELHRPRTVPGADLTEQVPSDGEHQRPRTGHSEMPAGAQPHDHRGAIKMLRLDVSVCVSEAQVCHETPRTDAELERISAVGLSVPEPRRRPGRRTQQLCSVGAGVPSGGELGRQGVGRRPPDLVGVGLPDGQRRTSLAAPPAAVADHVADDHHRAHQRKQQEHRLSGDQGDGNRDAQGKEQG